MAVGGSERVSKVVGEAVFHAIAFVDGDAAKKDGDAGDNAKDQRGDMRRRLVRSKCCGIRETQIPSRMPTLGNQDLRKM